MKSIFHVTATSAEDLRREVVAWHRDQQRRAASELEAHKRPSQVTIATLGREMYCHRTSAEFWEEVHIDPPTVSLGPDPREEP